MNEVLRLNEVTFKIQEQEFTGYTFFDLTEKKLEQHRNSEFTCKRIVHRLKDLKKVLAKYGVIISCK